MLPEQAELIFFNSRKNFFPNASFEKKAFCVCWGGDFAIEYWFLFLIISHLNFAI